MWYLVSFENPDVKYVLLHGKDYIVGRKDCDIIIANDPTVSRKHAVLNVIHSEANVSNPSKTPIIKIKDVSKFGTTVNKSRLNGETMLNDGDEIFFGSTKSTYLAVYEPFIITTSCLDNASKRLLKSSLCKLGGHTVSEWRKDCSLLVMNNISVTIKVICAMVSLKPIVTPQYIEDHLKSYQTKSLKPETDMYLPDIAETQVNPDEVSFLCNPERTKVFSGMKFIFLNPKQFKKMNLAVELGGGMPMLMEEGCDMEKKILIEKGSVIMNCVPDDTTLSQIGQEWVGNVSKYLKRHKKNMIMEAELGFAVLYCSTEKHCNPDLDTSKQSLLPVPSQTFSEQVAYTESEILAADTEESRMDRKKSLVPKGDVSVINQTTLEDNGDKGQKSEKMPSLVIPIQDMRALEKETESPSVQFTPGRHSKRQRDKEDENEIIPVKKIKQEVITPETPKDKTESQCSPHGNVNIKTEKQMPVTPGPPCVVESESTSHNSRTRSSRSVSPVRDVSPGPLFRSSPSPKRKTKPQTTVRNEKKIVEDDDDDDFISRNNRTDASEVSSDKCVTSRSIRKNSRNNTSGDDDSSSNEFDMTRSSQKRVPTKAASPSKRIKTSPSSKPREIIGSPSPKSRRRIKKSVSPKTKPIIEDSDDELFNDVVERDSVDFDSSKKFEKDISPTRVLKQEVIEEVEDTEENTNARYHVPPDGFLTTRNASREKPVIKSENDEENLPSNLVITEFASLVMRQTKKKTAAVSDDTPDGYVRWKGQVVKNFKQFRKTIHMGAGSLPKIIGGSDLQEHASTQRRDIDDFFKEQQQAESQVNEADRVAQELFNWESNAGKGKRKK